MFGFVCFEVERGAPTETLFCCAPLSYSNSILGLFSGLILVLREKNRHRLPEHAEEP